MGEVTEVDFAEGEVVNGFGDSGSEGFGSGAELGESSLEAERNEETYDRDNKEGGTEDAVFEGKNNKDE